MAKIHKIIDFVFSLAYDVYKAYLRLNMKKYWKLGGLFFLMVIGLTLNLCHHKTETPVVPVPVVQDVTDDTRVHIMNSIINNHVNMERYYAISKEIVRVSQLYPEISDSFLMSVIFRESSFNSSRTSPVGAMGLGQIMPQTMWWICNEMKFKCNKNTAFNYKKNIQMTAWYLHWIYENIKICNKDLKIVLAYYNSGGKNAYRYNLYLRKKKGIKLDSVNTYKANNVYRETLNYVDSVIVYDSIYNKLLNFDKGGK